MDTNYMLGFLYRLLWTDVLSFLVIWERSLILYCIFLHRRSRRPSKQASITFVHAALPESKICVGVWVWCVFLSVYFSVCISLCVFLSPCAVLTSCPQLWSCVVISPMSCHVLSCPAPPCSVLHLLPLYSVPPLVPPFPLSFTFPISLYLAFLLLPYLPWHFVSYLSLTCSISLLLFCLTLTSLPALPYPKLCRLY